MPARVPTFLDRLASLVDRATVRRVQTSAALWDIAGVPLAERSTGGRKRKRSSRIAARASETR